jgi:hypothetical protein
MLSKVKNGFFYDTDTLYTNNTAQNTSGGTAATTFMSYELPTTWNYLISITGHKQRTDTWGYYELYYSDNTSTSGKLWGIEITDITDDTYSIILENLTAWKTLIVRGQGAGSQSNNKVYFTKGVIYKLKATIPQTSSAIIYGYPTDIKAIWELEITTIYGKTPDNNYKGGIILGKTTTATTGEITLGNAVGFLSINIDGTLYKIPYYNE